ncbi:unnamed protein product [Zymoseptoria tritici ST99CH_3D1]|nr:unnamed protein product [Zymoseptoria tritici ST99CH_3D1]
MRILLQTCVDMFSSSNLCLLLLVSTATSTFARALIPQAALSDSSQIRIQPAEQHIPPPRTVTGGKHPFDAAIASVGVLLTSLDPNAEDMMHLWLPLGKIVTTSSSPILPLQPSTARITTFIHSRPDLVGPEFLSRIQCELWLYSNRTEGADKTERWKVSFSEKDGLVRFADRHGPFWLGGSEVESYHCFS